MINGRIDHRFRAVVIYYLTALTNRGTTYGTREAKREDVPFEISISRGNVSLAVLSADNLDTEIYFLPLFSIFLWAYFLSLSLSLAFL